MELSGVFYLAGAIVTLMTITDLIWTTLWVDGGAGPLSNRLARGIWWMSKRMTRKEKGLISAVGPLILILTLLAWGMLLWLGLALFFTGDPDSIVKTTFEGPVSWYERLYFSGFTLFTLGVGDYSPQPGFWQLITAFNSGLGLMLLTLGASYVISVISAVVKKRALARTITGLGTTSSDILKNSWNGDNFHQLDLILMTVSSQITELTQQHQAFPLLHFYHSRKAEESSAVSIALLDNALSVLHCGVNDTSVYNATLVREARSSIKTYLDTMDRALINESDREPSSLSLDDYRGTSIPLVSQMEFDNRLTDYHYRRRQLLGLVEADNHKWPEND